MESDDLFWMRRALAEAERGRGAVEPNPLVGAVVVREGRPVGVGHHARFGGPHAEVVALEAAGAAARGATLYVTLEPCCHHGKTPPCTEAVLAAGIRRVVAAMTDPFPKVAGGGFARLAAAGLEVESGLLETEARRLNAPYLKRLATGRPYVIAKWAMTLDGKTATASGDSRWISGPRSRALVHELRGRMDAILVGIGTALADDPQLTARPPGPRRAARVVLDSAARLPPDSRLARTAREIPVWVAVTERAGAERRAALAALGCDILCPPEAARSGRAGYRGEPAGAVEHDPRGAPEAGGSGGEPRIVGQGRADPDEDRVHPAAELVHQHPGAGPGDPSAVAGRRGGLAVEGHRPLGDHVRPTGRQSFQVRGIEPCVASVSSRPTRPPGPPVEPCEPAARHPGERVGHRRHDAVDARGEYRPRCRAGSCRGGSMARA